jgi:magnesium-transporting ATPase (P-type)
VGSAPERVERAAELHGRPGLSSDEARRRLAEHGPNVLATDRRRRLAAEFLARFRNPLVLLLLFHTGWFVESLATQVLVIFVIRTAGSPFASRPSGWLAATSLGVVAAALVLPFSPVARVLGFVPLPPAFLAVLVAAYLFAVEGVKRWFYRRAAASGAVG